MKRFLTAALLMLLCLCLSGCSQLQEQLETHVLGNVEAMVAEKADSSGAQALARTFIDGLYTTDAEQSLAAMSPESSMQELLAVFPDLQEMLPDAQRYTLTPIYVAENAANGVTQTVVQFRMEAAGEAFLVQTTQLSSMERLANIYITPWLEEPAESAPVQAAGEMGEILSLLTLAVLALIIWALVDCCRHRINRKWLWVLLILFGNALLTFSLVDGQMNLRFNLGLYITSTTCEAYADGFAIRFLMPVGSLAYLFMRRKLIIPAAVFKGNPAFDSPVIEDADAVRPEASDNPE